MANDELIKVSVFSAKYLDEASAKRDYYKAKKSYEDNNALDDFNAAVVFKKSSKEVDIIVKNEYSTRWQTWLGIIIGFTLAIFTIIFVSILIPGYFSVTETNEQHYLPFKIILVTLMGGLIGAVIGHLQSGMGRSDLKDLAKILKSDEYGLIVISFGKMAEKIKQLIPVENSIAHNEFETTKKKLVQKIKKSLTH